MGWESKPEVQIEKERFLAECRFDFGEEYSQQMAILHENLLEARGWQAYSELIHSNGWEWWHWSGSEVLLILHRSHHLHRYSNRSPHPKPFRPCQQHWDIPINRGNRGWLPSPCSSRKWTALHSAAKWSPSEKDLPVNSSWLEPKFRIWICYPKSRTFCLKNRKEGWHGAWKLIYPQITWYRCLSCVRWSICLFLTSKWNGIF